LIHANRDFDHPEQREDEIAQQYRLNTKKKPYIETKNKKLQELNFDRIDLTSNPNLGNIKKDVYGDNSYDSEGPKNGFFNLDPTNKETSKNSSPYLRFEKERQLPMENDRVE